MLLLYPSVIMQFDQNPVTLFGQAFFHSKLFSDFILRTAPTDFINHVKTSTFGNFTFSYYPALIGVRCEPPPSSFLQRCLSKRNFFIKRVPREVVTPSCASRSQHSFSDHLWLKILVKKAMPPLRTLSVISSSPRSPLWSFASLTRYLRTSRWLESRQMTPLVASLSACSEPSDNDCLVSKFKLSANINSPCSDNAFKKFTKAHRTRIRHRGITQRE